MSATYVSSATLADDGRASGGLSILRAFGFGRGAASRVAESKPQPSPVARRAEASLLRSRAWTYAGSHRSFSDDLYAAADRHERNA